MNKRETIANFREASYVTLKCSECKDKLRTFVSQDKEVAEKAWEVGWRWQNYRVLCQYCKDGKR